jgi:hypothetical protein
MLRSRARVTAATCVLAAPLAGCGTDDPAVQTAAPKPTPPRPSVTVSLSLERPPPGPPDAGTVGGHRAPDGVADVRAPALTFRARTVPGQARVTARATRGARVSVGAGHLVRVRNLPRGTTSVRLIATARGHIPWRGHVAITRR